MGMFSKKKDAGGDDDATRSALFGRKAKSSPAPQDSNPYAKPPVNDPYANAPPPYSGGNNSYRQEKSPAVTGQGQGYGRQGGGGGGYGAQGGSYAAGGGYGGDRYGGGGGAPQRQGGYGGLGSADPNDGTLLV